MVGFQAGLAARHIDLVDSWDYDKRQREMVEADAGMRWFFLNRPDYLP